MKRAYVLVLFICGSLLAARADGSGAQTYYAAIDRAIGELRDDLPIISASATAAAELFVKEDFPIAIAGNPRFISEATGRSGGLMTLVALPEDTTDWKSIVLYAIGTERFDEDLQRIADLRAGGSHVVVFARQAEIDRLPEGAYDSLVENHAADNDGVIATADGQWVVPTEGATDMTAMWTWTAEFVAACTRLEKMPTLYLGYVNEGGRARQDRIGSAKFHDETPTAIEPGQLGDQFLAILQANLRSVINEELEPIRAAATRANAAKSAGGTLYVATLGHAVQTLFASEPQPVGFVEWIPDQSLDVAVGANDFLLIVGYCVLPDSPGWLYLMDQMGKTPNAAWSISMALPAEAAKIPEGAIVINQHWQAGDADVEVEGYDIKIIPTSGILAETVYWMINAEMLEPL